MTGPQVVCDIDSLKRVERVYRERLVKEPADMSARVSLAWCLFMQAIHQAGKESAASALLGTEIATHITSDKYPKLDRDAHDLLKECLRQTYTVMQLSPDVRDHSDAEKLQTLVKLSGANETVHEMENEAMRILSEITREITREPLPPKGRLYRLPPRPQEA